MQLATPCFVKIWNSRAVHQSQRMLVLRQSGQERSGEQCCPQARLMFFMPFRTGHFHLDELTSHADSSWYMSRSILTSSSSSFCGPRSLSRYSFGRRGTARQQATASRVARLTDAAQRASWAVFGIVGLISQRARAPERLPRVHAVQASPCCVASTAQLPASEMKQDWRCCLVHLKLNALTSCTNAPIERYQCLSTLAR